MFLTSKSVTFVLLRSGLLVILKKISWQIMPDIKSAYLLTHTNQEKLAFKAWSFACAAIGKTLRSVKKPNLALFWRNRQYCPTDLFRGQFELTVVHGFMVK